jgi:hypothetical protein
MAPPKSSKRQQSTVPAQSATAAVTKKYRSTRAEKKPDAVWDRNRCLLKTLWIDYDYSVGFIVELLEKKNGESFRSVQ